MVFGGLPIPVGASIRPGRRDYSATGDLFPFSFFILFCVDRWPKFLIDFALHSNKAARRVASQFVILMLMRKFPEGLVQGSDIF